jgi:hypothetical protein
VIYTILSPLFAPLTLYVVHMPAEIGTMASYEKASQMAEFLKPKGRFPFVPLKDPVEEIKSFGFQAFITRFYNPGGFWKMNMYWVVLSAMAGLWIAGRYRRRNVLPIEVMTFGLASICVYFASRVLAFRLYVPDRHLQFPLGIFFITAFSIAAWRAFHHGGEEEAEIQDTSLARSWGSLLGLASVAALVLVGSGMGLNGAANFNYSLNKKGRIFSFVRANTPETALFAGDPTHIDALPLFGMRRAYATTETAHPFYDRYYEAIKPRLELSLRAHYARDLKELVDLLTPAGIDYFIFNNREFYPSALRQATYFPPFEGMVKELASRAQDQYAFRQLPARVDNKRFPFMPFRDDRSTLIDIKKLKEYLENDKG